ncbi:MAG: serine--tRNA ligase, partial [Rhodothermales bacterium]
MLDLQTLRDEPDRVRTAIQNKGLGNTDVVDEILALDVRRREVLTTLQEAQARSNTVSKEIGALMGQGKKDEAQQKIEETGRLKAQIKTLEEDARTVEEALDRLLLDVPNLPHPDVPVGRTPEENQVVHEWGERTSFSFEAKPHWALAEQHGLIDFERGAKVTGAGFPFYTGKGARLQRALINFFLDLAVDEGGYREIQPPLLVNTESATGTGQIPDKEGQMYKIVEPLTGTLSNEYVDQKVDWAKKNTPFVKKYHESTGKRAWSDTEFRKFITELLQMEREEAAATTERTLYLIPTSEVPVTNFFRGEILSEADLPVKFCAYTPCFRREAGSYGKDVRGLNRLHQFDKVELVQFVHPEASYGALETLRDDAEHAPIRLGLPYRRLLMCTGDMGFTQAMKYDLEVWSAGQARWLEVSSISNFEAFQARRTLIRYRPESGSKPQFVHTLNGSGLALPR